MRRSTTRYPILHTVAVFTAVALFLPHAPAWGGSFKAGAGIFFNDNEPGGGVSVDLGDAGLGFSPYVDYFGNSGLRVFGGGVNIVAKRAGGAQSQLYLGVGGGIASVEVEETSAGITGSASKTQAMADFVLGIEFDLHENIGGFFQVKWLGTFGGGRVDITGQVDGRTVTIPDAINLELRNFAAQAGVSIGFWN